MSYTHSASNELFAKSAVPALTPQALDTLAGRIKLRLERHISGRGSKPRPQEVTTSSSAVTTPSATLCPLTLEQHDSLLPPQASFGMGSSGSEHSSLPSLELPDLAAASLNSLTTIATSIIQEHQLQIAITPPQNGADKPNGKTSVIHSLFLKNSPSNWEDCSFATPDGRKASMLDISRGRLFDNDTSSDDSHVAGDLPISPHAVTKRMLSKLSVLVPEWNDSDYEALSALSAGSVVEHAKDADDEDEFVIKMADERQRHNRSRTQEEESMLLIEAALVPLPSSYEQKTVQSTNEEQGAPSVWDAPKESPKRGYPITRRRRPSVNASIDRSLAHLRNRLEGILSNFDDRINNLINNARFEFDDAKQQVKSTRSRRASAMQRSAYHGFEC